MVQSYTFFRLRHPKLRSYLCKLLTIIMCYLMSQKVMKSSKDHSMGEHYTLGFEELKIPV